MAFLSKLRSTLSIQCRNMSSILNPNDKTPMTSKEKSRAALSLLKSEKNPQRILDICRAASLTPESHLDRIAFSVAISKLTDSNHFQTIRSFLDDLPLSRPDLRTERFFSHSIILYGQAGLLENALKTFEKITEFGLERTVKSLNALLLSCILSKNYDEVKRIYVEFPKKYGIQPNLGTYNTVIKAFCESGCSNSVFSVVSEMDRKGVKPNSRIGTLIAGFDKEGKFEEVGKVLGLMRKYDMVPGISIYSIRIQSLCKLRKSVKAKALLDGMLSWGMKPNSVSYCHLIHGFCKEGNLEEAKRLFKKMASSGCQPDTDCFFTLVYFLCENMDFEASWEICMESMDKDWVPNLSTIQMLMNGLLFTRKVEEARELVEQMKEKFPEFADAWSELEEG